VAVVTYLASSSMVRILGFINLVCALIPALVWGLLRRVLLNRLKRVLQ
jgi:hypothetical protein